MGSVEVGHRTCRSSEKFSPQENKIKNLLSS